MMAEIGGVLRRTGKTGRDIADVDAVLCAASTCNVDYHSCDSGRKINMNSAWIAASGST
jgi:hypothetical protein